MENDIEMSSTKEVEVSGRPHRKYLFYFMGGGDMSFDDRKEKVIRDDEHNIWIIHHNDPKNTVTIVPISQLAWVRSWDGE